MQLFGKTCSVHLLVNYGKPKTAIRNIGTYTYCYETARVQQKKCTKCGKTNFYERTVLNKYKHTYKKGSKTCSRCGYVNKILYKAIARVGRLGILAQQLEKFSFHLPLFLNIIVNL